MAEFRKVYVLIFSKRCLQTLRMNEAHNPSLRRQELVEKLVLHPHTKFRRTKIREYGHSLDCI